MILTCMQRALVSVNRKTLCAGWYGLAGAVPKNWLLMLTWQRGLAAAVGAAVALVMPSRPVVPTATATAAPRRTALFRVKGLRMISPASPCVARDRIPLILIYLRIPPRHPC